MNSQDIDLYFSALASHLKTRTRVILTGGAASLIMGGARPTRDVDFEIQAKLDGTKIEQAIRSAEQITGLASEYSSDIERWSMLNMPSYRKHVRLYKRFTDLSVYLLTPEYWSIGKLGRYWDSDIHDLLAVLAEQKTRPAKLLKVWCSVLKASPLSDELFHFKRHVEHFVKIHGQKLWGKSFEAVSFLKRFRK